MPDLSNRTVRLPVIADRNGLLTLHDGLPLPHLKRRAHLELLVPLTAFADPNQAASYVQEYVETIAPEDTIAAVGISPRSVSAEEREHMLQPHQLKISSPYIFVEARLKAALRLRFRTGKSPQLDPCKCVIPIIKDGEVSSLNHAYTRISEHYEPHRISHTANVFERAYLFLGNSWVLLDAIRQSVTMESSASFTKVL